MHLNASGNSGSSDWPARREVPVAIANEQFARVDIDPAGTVSTGTATSNTVSDARSWLSL